MFRKGLVLPKDITVLSSHCEVPQVAMGFSHVSLNPRQGDGSSGCSISGLQKSVEVRDSGAHDRITEERWAVHKEAGRSGQVRLSSTDPLGDVR